MTRKITVTATDENGVILDTIDLEIADDMVNVISVAAGVKVFADEELSIGLPKKEKK